MALQESTPAPTTRPASEEVRAIIRNDIQALNNRDVDAAVRFDAEDKLLVLPQATLRGLPEMRRYVTWLLEQFPVLKLTENRIVVEGETGVCEYTLEGTNRDGKSGKLGAVGVYRITDGKTHELHMYFDRLAMADQLAKSWLQHKVVHRIVTETARGL